MNGIFPALTRSIFWRVDVVDADPVAAVGKGKGERQPDVTATTDDHHVQRPPCSIGWR